MSTSLQNIEKVFNEYISAYIGLIPLNKNIDEKTLIPTINRLAYDNLDHYIEFSKIIIKHLKEDNTQNKIRLFHIIDSLFKNVGKPYIEYLSKYLHQYFKECFNLSDLEDRILLFRIFYTWKYIVPLEITEEIRKDLNLDDFKQMAMKDYAKEIKACDDYNEAQRQKKIKNAKNNSNDQKEKKEDKKTKAQTHNKNISISANKINIGEQSKKQNPDNLIGKKRKALQDKPSDTTTITKKKKKSENKNQNNNIQNNNNLPTNFIPQPSNQVNMTNTINIPQNNNNNNNLQFLNNNNQNIIQNMLGKGPDQQQMVQNIINIIRNNQLNLIPNFPFFPNAQYPVSKNEINIFNFLFESNIKLDENLRFFSSLAKFFNESVNNKYMIKINCQYEDIYKNQEYQQIYQNQNNLLFNNIKKNLCTICGFRTLYYNKLTEHLDIHFNVNYLQKEGKNLFRKKGNNRNNWITGDIYNNKKNKDNRMNGIGYTLSNLLFYKNMMNNNLIKINNEGQEEDNEELMYPIDDNNIRCCELCGDEFKKIFSNKYNYWFYSDIIKIKDEKMRLLVHKACYEDLVKKN